MLPKKTLIAAALSSAVSSYDVAAASNPAAAGFQVMLRVTEACAVTAGSDALPAGADDAAGSGGSTNIHARCSGKSLYSITLQPGSHAGSGTSAGGAADGAPPSLAPSAKPADTVTVSVYY